MYQLIFKQQVTKGFANISKANFEAVLSLFAEDIHFTFVGNHALGGDWHDRAMAKRWFERVHRLFPDLQLRPKQIRVAGWPWDVTVTTQFAITATLPDKSQYRNEGVQILRIRWGTIVSDYLIEDTQLLSTALAQIASRGNVEAAEGRLSPPLSPLPTS
ncbi:MAG: nuclear transport factor 2 family protein [Chloroflexota bacterium]